MGADAGGDGLPARAEADVATPSLADEPPDAVLEGPDPNHDSVQVEQPFIADAWTHKLSVSGKGFRVNCSDQSIEKHNFYGLPSCN